VGFCYRRERKGKEGLWEKRSQPAKRLRFGGRYGEFQKKKRGLTFTP